jgi:hypothetical protein
MGGKRWLGIYSALLRGDHFLCHKTTPDCGDGSNLVCAGSLEWQHRRKITPGIEQIFFRIRRLIDERRSSA